MRKLISTFMLLTCLTLPLAAKDPPISIAFPTSKGVFSEPATLNFLVRITPAAENVGYCVSVQSQEGFEATTCAQLQGKDAPGVFHIYPLKVPAGEYRAAAFLIHKDKKDEIKQLRSNVLEFTVVPGGSKV